MIAIMRTVLAGLSACGVAVSITAYLANLSGTTFDDTSQWVAVLVAGAIAIQLPMLALERSWGTLRVFFWKGFGRVVPRWAVVFVQLCWLVALGHFIWLFIKSDYAIPVVQQGQFILSRRGRIVSVITEQEYLALKADELRVFASLMIACYLVPMMYWWFSRNPPSSPNPGRRPSGSWSRLTPNRNNNR